MPIQALSLDLIDVYGGTQSRVKTDDEAIASYAEEMAQGAVFPPIVVYFDGASHWLADGFHRYLATKRSGGETIQAEVHAGGRTDALRHALGANATNGVFRNNADKRNAAEIALEEWPDLANPVLAEICRVSTELVRRCRQELVQAQRIPASAQVTGKDGKTYPSKIEREPRERPSAPPAKDPEGEAGAELGALPARGMAGPWVERTWKLEHEARAMIRKGEMNPFELPTLTTSTPHDYAETVIALLGKMRSDDPKRPAALLRIRRWLDKALAGESGPLEADLEEAVEA